MFFEVVGTVQRVDGESVVVTDDFGIDLSIDLRVLTRHHPIEPHRLRPFIGHRVSILWAGRSFWVEPIEDSEKQEWRWKGSIETFTPRAIDFRRKWYPTS